MSQKILILSGRKQSGKSTLANFLQGLELLNLGLVNEFEVSSKTNGQLWVRTPSAFGELDLCSQDKATIEWASNNLWPFVKQYAYADELKNFCVNVLLLTPEQVYGTNEQKSTPTKYVWENMPGKSLTSFAERTGTMLAREVVQYVGTEICRKMNPDVWVGSCMSRIKREDTELAIITDCRFPNEVYASIGQDAKVIRLARNIYPEDKHDSETALDVENFDWKNFDYILDNTNIPIEESCARLVAVLKDWGWLSYDVKL